MRLQVWRRPSAKRVPDRVWRRIATQFRMDVSQIANMRCVEKKGRLAGRPVTYVRIFDPTAISGVAGDGVVREYGDLDSHAEAVLFEGQIEQDGNVFLWDRRQTGGQPPPKASVTPSSLASPR